MARPGEEFAEPPTTAFISFNSVQKGKLICVRGTVRRRQGWRIFHVMKIDGTSVWSLAIPAAVDVVEPKRSIDSNFARFRSNFANPSEPAFTIADLHRADVGEGPPSAAATGPRGAFDHRSSFARPIFSISILGPVLLASPPASALASRLSNKLSGAVFDFLENPTMHFCESVVKATTNSCAPPTREIVPDSQSRAFRIRRISFFRDPCRFQHRLSS